MARQVRSGPDRFVRELEALRRTGLGRPSGHRILAITRLAPTHNRAGGALSLVERLERLFKNDLLPRLSPADAEAASIYFGYSATYRLESAASRRTATAEVFHQSYSNFRNPVAGQERPFLQRLAVTLAAIEVEKSPGDDDLVVLPDLLGQFVARYEDEPFRRLLIFGPPGSGKTSLARLLLGELVAGDYATLVPTNDHLPAGVRGLLLDGFEDRLHAARVIDKIDDDVLVVITSRRGLAPLADMAYSLFGFGERDLTEVLDAHGFHLSDSDGRAIAAATGGRPRWALALAQFLGHSSLDAAGALELIDNSAVDFFGFFLNNEDVRADLEMQADVLVKIIDPLEVSKAYLALAACLSHPSVPVHVLDEICFAWQKIYKRGGASRATYDALLASVRATLDWHALIQTENDPGLGPSVFVEPVTQRLYAARLQEFPLLARTAMGFFQQQLADRHEPETPLSRTDVIYIDRMRRVLPYIGLAAPSSRHFNELVAAGTAFAGFLLQTGDQLSDRDRHLLLNGMARLYVQAYGVLQVKIGAISVQEEEQAQFDDLARALFTVGMLQTQYDDAYLYGLEPLVDHAAARGDFVHRVEAHLWWIPRSLDEFAPLSVYSDWATSARAVSDSLRENLADYRAALLLRPNERVAWAGQLLANAFQAESVSAYAEAVALYDDVVEATLGGTVHSAKVLYPAVEALVAQHRLLLRQDRFDEATEALAAAVSMVSEHWTDVRDARLRAGVSLAAARHSIWQHTHDVAVPAEVGLSELVPQLERCIAILKAVSPTRLFVGAELALQQVRLLTGTNGPELMADYCESSLRRDTGWSVIEHARREIDRAKLAVLGRGATSPSVAAVQARLTDLMSHAARLISQGAAFWAGEALAAANALSEAVSPHGDAGLPDDSIRSELRAALQMLPDYAYVRPWILAGEEANPRHLLVL